MEIRRSEFLDMGVHACMRLFILFVLGVSVCTVVHVGGVTICINAWPWMCLSAQPCITSNICSPAALPSEGGWAVTHSRTLWHDPGEQHGATVPGATGPWESSNIQASGMSRFLGLHEWYSRKSLYLFFPNKKNEEWTQLRANFHFWSFCKSGAAPSHVGHPLVEPWTIPSLAFVTDIAWAWAKGLDQSGRHVCTLITNIFINVLGSVSSGWFVHSFCLCSLLESQRNTECAPRMHHGVFQALILHF